MKITKKLVKEIDRLLSFGLVRGLGKPKPGKMCVEALICKVLGEEHSDSPSCVALAVKEFKIILNDACWSSNMARAEGIRDLAIAQLGSINIDTYKFNNIVAKETIKQLLPRIAQLLKKNHGIDLSKAAARCKKEGSKKTALAFKMAAYAYTDDATTDSVAASVAASAAYASASYASATADEILILAAKIGLKALKACKSPGVKFI